MRVLCNLCCAVIWATVSTLPAVGADLQPCLNALRAVGPEGAGNREAGRAWERLVQADAEDLPVILAALDEAQPLGANWIRTAVDTIAEGELRRGRKLPMAELERFVLDNRHAPHARRLAYEWLRRVDPSAPQRLIPGTLNDPSLEMRRDAVVRLMEIAEGLVEGGKSDQAVAVCQQALSAARDLDQINQLAERLRKLDQVVDLPRQFGFLVRWKLIGPFDNTDEKGFNVVYPPENEIDLQASYEGKHGEVKWIDHLTKDDHGMVDLNAALGEEKSVVAYAMAKFVSETQREAEIRAASHNAVKLWLNGKLLEEHEVYFGGSQMDQYVSRVVLEAGPNVILVKACQNAQTESWAKQWGFQLRVCDSDGAAILSSDRDQ